MNSSNPVTSRRQFLLSAAGAAAGLATWGMRERSEDERPNILFFLGDDQSWIDCSAYGNRFVRTPNVDRLAREGVRFTQAFVSTPSCTPSRAAICTGRNFWELGRGSVLHSPLPRRYVVYQDLLEDAGYVVGYTGKGWGPGSFQDGGRERNPAGPRFNRLRVDPPLPEGFSSVDYAANFARFLRDRPPGRPFSFWIGTFEPHHPLHRRNYRQLEASLEELPLPSFIPDTPGTRRQRGNYYYEIEYADRQLGRAIEALERAGELENTLIVFTSDNGTPLPRAKANLYDWGTRVPLIARWPGQIDPGRTVDDPVNVAGLAPTFLEVAGLEPPEEMSVRSILDLLEADGSGYLDDSRTEVCAGMEWHNHSYPMRMIRTRTHLYIENYHSGPRRPRRLKMETSAPAYEEGYQRFNPYQMLIRYPEHPDIRPYWEKCYGPRPGRELYEVETDPENLDNLAEEPEQRTRVEELAGRLEAKLEATGDPRATGHPEVFEEIVAAVEKAREESD